MIARQGEPVITDRGADRGDTARRNDDSDIAEAIEAGAGFGGSAGGNLQCDIGSRDEMGDRDGVTRVRDSDKSEQADLPRFNPS